MIFLEDIEFEDNKKYVVFGYGQAGKMIGDTIKRFYPDIIFQYCDNNPVKQNPDKKVCSLRQCDKNSIFLIGFMGNDAQKQNSACNDLKEYGVSGDSIVIIDMKSKLIWQYQKFILDEYCPLVENKPKEVISHVENVCFVSYMFTAENEKRAGGGPIGALCMQKKFLKHYSRVKLCFPYIEADATVNSDIFGVIRNIEAVQRMCEKYSNTIFVCNDIFSAYGLYLLGKNYILIYHMQGDDVSEYLQRGLYLSEETKAHYWNMERIAAKNAFRMCFPSEGAEIYFRKAVPFEVVINKTKPLYNTINDYPVMERIEDIERDETAVTFLSVSQLLETKGVDLIPDFLQRYQKYSQKRIRWVLVGRGYLYDKIHSQMKNIMDQNTNIEFIHYSTPLSHGQIFYLMNLCDVYLLLHRVSIFDFSTLEAMYHAKPIILSDIEGNREFDVDNNILLVNCQTNTEAIDNYIENGNVNGRKNRMIYEQYFSQEPFQQKYFSLLNEFINQVERGSVL